MSRDKQLCHIGYIALNNGSIRPYTQKPCKKDVIRLIEANVGDDWPRLYASGWRIIKTYAFVARTERKGKRK